VRPSKVLIMTHELRKLWGLMEVASIGLTTDTSQSNPVFCVNMFYSGARSLRSPEENRVEFLKFCAEMLRARYTVTSGVVAVMYTKRLIP